MRKNTLRRPSSDVICLLLLLAMSFVSSNANAARWYHVEMIVFKHLDPALTTGEDWSVPEKAPNFATAIDLVEHNSDAGNSTGQGFRALSDSSLKLAGVYQRLRGSANYKPILHKAWRQPGYSANSVRQVYVSTKPSRGSDMRSPGIELGAANNEDANDWVEGTLGLQGGRLLHLAAKFVYRKEEIITNIGEFRQIKLKQLHYFDHPLFGVIVQVTPYRAAEATE
jgi:hypothetical protein